MSKILLASIFFGFIVENVICGIATSTSSSLEPIYQPQDVPKGYVPHSTYPYADAYGPISSPYEGYMYPSNYPVPGSSLIPVAQGALQIALRIFAKVGLFLIGGVTLLLVGGIFTTAVCSLTPICTITFSGFGSIDKDTMRSFMTPEKISTAAALVQDAIGKYQRLQRTANN